MHAYLKTARRAALLAILVIAAACSPDAKTGTGIDNGNGNGNGGNDGDGNGNGNGGNNGGSLVFRVDLTGSDEVVVGYRGQVSGRALDQNGGVVPAAITYTVSDAALAAIDVDGNITARAEGTVVVTARAEGKEAQRAVRLVPRRVTFLEPDTHQAPLLQRGDIGWFTVYPLDQHRQLIKDVAIAYTVADPTIVEQRGSEFIARRGGATQVTATAQGVSATTVLRVAESTTYPLRAANGTPLGATIFESRTVDEHGYIHTYRLVATSGALTISNVADTWSQRITVEEWRFTQYGENGSTVGGMVTAETQQTAGTFVVDAETGALLLSDSASGDAPLWAWFEAPRGFRVVDPAGGATLEYYRW